MCGLEEETKRQITMKKLEVQHSSLSPDCCDKFDMNLRFCLVPLFNDKDVDKHFIIFVSEKLTQIRYV